MSVRSVALVIVVVAITNQMATPSDADWQWLDASREQAFDRLLPVAAHPGQLVAYRSYRDFYQDVPEQYLRVERDPGRPAAEGALRRDPGGASRALDSATTTGSPSLATGRPT